MASSVDDEKLGAEFREYANDDSMQVTVRSKTEAALVRKLDCFIAPVMMLLMLISYLDRGNIGFAATQGMAEDIGLKGSELNVCELLAYFLNDGDKAAMKQRAELMEAYSGGSGHYGKKDIKEAASDIKSWAHGFGTFLPIIIKNGFHYSTVQAQYLVIPVNLWGAIVYAVGAFLSDRYQTRFWPLIVCAPFGIAGYAICLAPVSAGVQYFATYLIATACFLCTGGNM
ncbi:hypothetical protein SLS54_007557 [Diplodia seriata]